MLTRRLIALTLVVSFVAPLAAVDSKKVAFIGGTVAGMPANVEGKLDTSHEEVLTFTPDKKDVKPMAVRYEAITALEYGQKAGRRVGVGIMVTPLALFSKKRRHYLTITFTSPTTGKEEAAILEVGKDIIRTTLTIVETRSGKEIEYQDDEARKAGRGN